MAQAFVSTKSSATTRLPSVTFENFRPATQSPVGRPHGLTSLHERRWNFNEGQGPWGLKKNAEIWNGRVAQMAFVLVFLQELIQGKGVLKGISEGDPINYAFLAVFVLSTGGLTAWLALQGKNSYVDKDLGK